MNTKSKATVATIGLGALVLSGGTLALWQDHADLNNAEINTGHLSIVSGDALYYDISALKLQEDVGDDQPGHVMGTISPDGDGSKSLAALPDHEIDIDTFEATPGDTILVVQKITPQLRGHNLLARVEIIDADGGALESNVTYNGASGGDAEAFSISDPQVVRDFKSQTGELIPLDTKNVAAIPGGTAWVFTEADSNQNLFVAYEVTFSEDDGPVGGDLTDAPQMDATVTIQNLGVQLTQVRAETP